MPRKPDEDVPGVERITTVDKLGSLDIGRIVQLVYGDVDDALRAKRRKHVLRSISEQPRFKGMMPQPPQYILQLGWMTTNILNEGNFDTVGPLDGSRKIIVGRKYERRESRYPRPPMPSDLSSIPKAPKKPANVAWTTETPKKTYN